MRDLGRLDQYLDEINEPRGYPSGRQNAGAMITNESTKRRDFARAFTANFAIWGLYFVYLWPRMLFVRGDGLYAGWRTLWADWSVHFAYANVFAYRGIGDWFSTSPVFSGAGFHYPFLADGLSGLLMRAGLDRVGAFVFPSVIASLALVALLFVFYAAMLRSPRMALLASALFFTNGGVGFLDFAVEMAQEPSLDTLLIPPREYTWSPKQHIWWINIVSSELLPQRALLLGIPLGLTVLIALRRYVEADFEGVSRARLVALGATSALLVITHMHSFLALVLLCGMCLLFHRRNYPQWLTFAISAGLPSVILFWLLYAGSGAGGFVEWFPGWLQRTPEHRDTPLWLFLWLNWGVFLPLAAVSLVRFRYYRDPLVLGGAVLFVICFLLRFQPNTWDNTKLLTWSHLLLCIPVAHYLAHLWSKRALISRFVAVLLFVFTVASGSLDLWRMTRTEAVAHRMWTTAEMQLADDFRATSEPTSLVLCSDDHHHWVPSLSGRQVLLGYRGWLASYGLDYGPIVRDMREMLSGGADAEALLARYEIDFVVIGRTERRDFDANESYFERNHELIFDRAGNKVFGVHRKPGSSRL
jgi:hypothetical protein